MPKSKSAIPNDTLIKQLDDLSASILITPEQVELILSRSTAKLSEDRAAGNPPPFVKIGGTNRYRVGDVRDLIKSRVFNNTAEASKFERERLAELGYTSFASFLNEADISEQWPFALIQGKPVDFFFSLTLQLSDDDQCKWLTLGEYLTQRKQWAESRPAVAQSDAIRELPAVAETLAEEMPRKPPLL